MPAKVLFIMISILSAFTLSAKKVELTPMISKNFTDKNEVIKDARYLGVRLSQYISKSFALRLGFDATLNDRFKPSYHTYAKSSDVSRYFFEAKKDFIYFDSFTPYLFGGFGYEKVTNESEDDTFSSQPFADAGAGVKIPISDRYSIAAETSALKKIYNDNFNYSVSFGIGYSFYNTLLDPAPPKPKTHQKKRSDFTKAAFYKKKIKTYKETKKLKNAIERLKPVPATKKKKISTSIIKSDQNTTVAKSKKTVPIKTSEPLKLKKMTKPSKKAPVYFIQVAAAYYDSLEKKEKKLIQKIKKSGYPWVIRSLKLKGKPVQRLLAGPFKSFKEAKEKLKKIKKINKKSFIRRVEPK